MSWQALLLETQILSRAVDSLLSPPPVQRKSTAVKLALGLSVVLVCVGLGFLGVGIYMWLGELYPPRMAMLMMGGIVVAFALFTGGIAMTAANYRRIHAKVREKVIRHKLHELMSAVTEEFEDSVRQYPKTAAAAAALAGVIIGEHAARHNVMLKDAVLKDLVTGAKEHIIDSGQDIKKTIIH